MPKTRTSMMVLSPRCRLTGVQETATCRARLTRRLRPLMVLLRLTLPRVPAVLVVLVVPVVPVVPAGREDPVVRTMTSLRSASLQTLATPRSSSRSIK